MSRSIRDMLRRFWDWQKQPMTLGIFDYGKNEKTTKLAVVEELTLHAKVLPSKNKKVVPIKKSFDRATLYVAVGSRKKEDKDELPGHIGLIAVNKEVCVKPIVCEDNTAAFLIVSPQPTPKQEAVSNQVKT